MWFLKLGSINSCTDLKLSWAVMTVWWKELTDSSYWWNERQQLHLCNKLKVIRQDLTRDNQYILLFTFFHHKIIWNDPRYQHITPSVYSHWLLWVKSKYSKYSVSYSLLQYKQDPGKVKGIADSVVTTTPTI